MTDNDAITAAAATVAASDTGAPETAGPATPEPAPEPAPDSWRAALPAALRNDSTLAPIKDIAGLAKGYAHLSRALGVPPDRLLKLPAADAGPTAWDAVHARLGRPEAPDGYDLPAPPDGVAVDPERLAGFRTTAHRLGLSNDQAAGLLQWWGDGQAARETDPADPAQSDPTASDPAGPIPDPPDPAGQRAAWIAAQQDLPEGTIADAQWATRRLLDTVPSFKPILDELLDGTGLGDRPDMLTFMAELGRTLLPQEDGNHAAAGDGRGGAVTPETALERMAALRADRDWMTAYMRRHHPGHARARREMARLSEIAFGTRPVVAGRGAVPA